MSEKRVLQRDIIIRAGTVFVKGPTKREYAGTNYEALISLSDDETGEVTLYVGEPAADALLESE